MHRIAVVVAVLSVGCGTGSTSSQDLGGSDSSSTLSEYEIRERAAQDRRIRDAEQSAAARRQPAPGQSSADSETDPCGYVDENYSRMLPAERNRMLTACANAVIGSGPNTEAAEYLRGVAGCLRITRPRLLGVFTHPNPELLVNTIARSCMEDPDLSPDALALAEQAVARIDDFLDLAHVDDEEQFDFVLGNISAAYEREANRLNRR